MAGINKQKQKREEKKEEGICMDMRIGEGIMSLGLVIDLIKMQNRSIIISSIVALVETKCWAVRKTV